MYYHAYNRSIFAYLVRCYARTQQTRDIEAMVGQRRERCANVNPTLGQCCNNNDSGQFKKFCQNSTTMGTQYCGNRLFYAICIYLYHNEVCCSNFIELRLYNIP